ncbi:MAG: hypothetical protein KBT06_03525 [Prevotellaceae bacterium]|nr:hypothetical protein [Candidatus Colivivens equi]
MKTHSLKCKDCNGTMILDENKTIIACPYCGSKELIEESDEVKIETIKANKEIEMQKEAFRAMESEDKRDTLMIAGMMILLAISCVIFELIS